MSWIDDNDRKRKDISQRDEILKAKAVLFFDHVFESVKRDVATIKQRYQADISVRRPEPELIVVSKQKPYPTFSIEAGLDVLSKSVKVEWSRTEDRDRQVTRQAVIWYLSLDSNNNLHVTADDEEIEADNASERMLRPMTA